jgi:hypothetical protein
MNIRINNIGAVSTKYDGFHIVKYMPNDLYGKLEEYLKDGWEDDGDFVVKPQMSVDKNCFSNKENQYVVAFLKYEQNNYCTRIESVRDRLLDLSKQERDDFWEVYEIADRKICEKADKDE